MTLPSSLYSYLSGVSALTALVSDRIYPARGLAGDSYPLVVFMVDPEVQDYAMFNVSEMFMTDIKFEIVGDDYVENHEVYKQIRIALDGQTGTMGDVLLRHVFFKLMRDAGYDDKQRVFMVQATVEFWYKDA